MEGNVEKQYKYVSVELNTSDRENEEPLWYNSLWMNVPLYPKGILRSLCSVALIHEVAGNNVKCIRCPFD